MICFGCGYGCLWGEGVGIADGCGSVAVVGFGVLVSSCLVLVLVRWGVLAS